MERGLPAKKTTVKKRIQGRVDKRHRIEYNPALLPQTKIDLDEIDKFLAHDIFVQELISGKQGYPS